MIVHLSIVADAAFFLQCNRIRRCVMLSPQQKPKSRRIPDRFAPQQAIYGVDVSTPHKNRARPVTLMPELASPADPGETHATVTLTQLE